MAREALEDAASEQELDALEAEMLAAKKQMLGECARLLDEAGDAAAAVRQVRALASLLRDLRKMWIAVAINWDNKTQSNALRPWCGVSILSGPATLASDVSKKNFMALLQISEHGQSPDPHQRRIAVGIDLGTTHSGRRRAQWRGRMPA